MVDAIQDNKEGKSNEVMEAYIQAIQNNTPAGLVNASDKPTCSPVQEIGDTSKSQSIETATEPISGRLETINNTDLKRYSAAVDQRNQDTTDISMKQDADGDGLVDGLDKKTKTRAEEATEKMDEISRKSKENNKKLKNVHKKTQLSISESTPVNEQIGTLANINKNDKKGPGNIDFSAEKNENKDNITSISSMDSSN